MICGDNPTYGWVYGWFGWWVGQLVESCQITKNQINLDFIQIIQFCLQIDDLWRYLHAHTTHWSQSLAIEIMSIIHNPTVWLCDNWHRSIMHNLQFLDSLIFYIIYYLNYFQIFLYSVPTHRSKHCVHKLKYVYPIVCQKIISLIMSPTILLMWIISANKGMDIIFPEGDRSFVV